MCTKMLVLENQDQEEREARDMWEASALRAVQGGQQGSKTPRTLTSRMPASPYS